MRTYYKATITSHSGITWDNPLLPKELHLIATFLKDNREVRVIKVVTHKADFESIFGQSY